MLLTFDLMHRGQLPLPAVVEGVMRRGLQVGRVVPRGGGRAVAAFAHARVVAKPALLQVRVGERVHDRDTFRRVEH